MTSIGVRELRQHASRWLARVAAGETFTVTDRGRPVASLTPVTGSDWERLVATDAVLRAEGTLRDPGPGPAPEVPGAERTLSELLGDDRDRSR